MSLHKQVNSIYPIYSLILDIFPMLKVQEIGTKTIALSAMLKVKYTKVVVGIYPPKTPVFGGMAPLERLIIGREC